MVGIALGIPLEAVQFLSEEALTFKIRARVPEGGVTTSNHLGLAR